MEVCNLLAGFRENWKYMKRHRSHTIDCVLYATMLEIIQCMIYTI